MTPKAMLLTLQIFQCRGYNIGTRLIDEFLAKSKTTKCLSFRDAVDKMAKVRFHRADTQSECRLIYTASSGLHSENVELHLSSVWCRLVSSYSWA